MLSKKRIHSSARTLDLHHKTVGIVGLGGNGRRLAQILAPFQVKIVATDLFPYDCPTEVEQLWGADELPRLLSVSDIVILCLPLNVDTIHLFDYSKFQQMKDDSIFINVARGQVVKENDLVKSLKSGKIKLAGIDVAEVEPLPQESPLWEMQNVIITPHVGAQGVTRNDDATDLFCENLENFLSGQPLKNLVDKKLGFPVRKRSGT